MTKIFAAAAIIFALTTSSQTNAQTKKEVTRTTKPTHSTTQKANARTMRGTAATKKVVKDAKVSAPGYNSRIANVKRETVRR